MTRNALLASVSLLATLLAQPLLAVGGPLGPATEPSAEAAGWTGFYMGAYVGSGLVDSAWGAGTGPFAPLAPASPDKGYASGAMVGVQAGYNYQVGAYVLGIEGDFGSGFQLSRTRCYVNWTQVCSADTDFLATVTGRLGYAFDNMLVYGKAGAAFTDLGMIVTSNNFASQYAGSSLRTGWTVGGGLEMGLTPQLSAKAEYAYLNFGSSYEGLQSAYGFTGSPVSQSAQMVKLGLNWRPWGAPLPGTGASLPASGRDWTGLYVGAHAGGAWGRDEWTSGTGFLAQAAAAGAFPGQGSPMGLLVGGQVGFNYQMGALVAGVEASGSFTNLNGNARCLSGHVSDISNFVCQSALDSLGSISGRLGQSWGDLLLYAKGGAAWASGSSAVFMSTDIVHYTGGSTRWGWMLGGGVEYALTQSLSAFLDYSYYDFGTQEQTYSGLGRSATADFKQRLDAVRMGLNYRFTSGASDQAIQPTMALPAGWRGEVGGRYFVSTGRMQKDLLDNNLPLRLNSRLIYANTTGQSLETFFRFENDNGVFLKGFAGLGTLAGGDLNDEDFPSEVVYSNTISKMRDGQLGYGALDLGYELVRRGESTLGAFVGYRAWYQNVNGFGCMQLAGDVTCDMDSWRQGPAIATSLGLSETETWQGVSLGLNGRLQLADRIKLEVDAAVLPYLTRSGMDNHWFRGDINPQMENGRGWGVQLEASLSYAVTERLNVGVGGRYWYATTNIASTPFPEERTRSPQVFFSERYGGFLQASYRFGDVAPLSMDGAAPAAAAAPAEWTGLYVGGALGGGKGHSTYASPFAPPVSGDAVDLGGLSTAVQIGGDYQMGAAVVGAEATVGWAHVSGTDTCFSTAPAGPNSGFNCGSRMNALGTVTGRLGYAFDQALVYARGGFAWGRQTDGFNTFAYNTQVLSHTSTNTGWTLGGGVEYALLPNLSVGLEYKHFDFGASPAFFTGQPLPLAGVDLAPGRLRLDMVGMTVNYRFATFGGTSSPE